MSGTISRDECLNLNDILGVHTPSGCYSLTHNSGNDKFTYSHNEGHFQGEDADRHRNSWLMPKMARRLTKKSKYHVSNWRQPVTVNEKECEDIRKALEKKLGSKEAKLNLPKACKN
mmetsp:Transcript_26734/g.40421  ORF Transcript_26734/g.40421 Transcript_26734/m.40421 type:complete len:116 (+) Transcript_26734:90-437(+)|eukprot:CAMPEP_0178915580 /NCGR_PEP_ID=MMETSP0786-20121207/12103_1 /TAXON_ID=186022 /ORGANISM="Thalassionema frauenfeldii, Strain CCMP 1798" /LENGTH=115 /DNA_ID=CAMNT_0020588701 /DNA_START=90 /DNA_END=437 /DNA_ORIENTATION=+